MNLSFRGVAIASCIFCVCGALLWTTLPQLAAHFWETEPSHVTGVLSRRYAAALFALATILYAARNAEPSTARRAISLGFAVGGIVMSVMSIGDWLTAEVGLAMLMAVALQTVMTACFIVLWHTERAAAASTAPASTGNAGAVPTRD